MMRFFVILCLVCSAATSIAQTGAVRGLVTDGDLPLPGATVRVVGFDELGTVTDIQGRFLLRNIPAGAQTLEFTYIGFEHIELEITVQADETSQIEKVVLDQGLLLSEAIIESDFKANERHAMELMKVDKRIVNVLAAEGMSKLPDRNAAEALQRLPAVALERDQGEGRYVSIRGTPHDWSAAQINGDRLPVADEAGNSRTMAFDVIPTELIEYIVVAKSLTPDMEGDAIGGSINFLTRAAPLEKTIKFSAAAGYNDQSGKPTFHSSFLYGNRSKNKKWGGQVSGVVWHRNYGTDRYQAAYGSNFNHALNRFELRDYIGKRTTIGLSASGEYRASEKLRFYTKTFFGSMRDEERNRKVMFNYATGAGRTYRQQHIHAIYQMRLFSGEIGMSYKLSDRRNLDVRIASYDNRFGYGDVPIKGTNDMRNGYYVTQFESPNLAYDDMVFLDAEGNYLPSAEGAVNELKLLGSDHPLGGDSPDRIQPMPNMDIGADNIFFIGAYTELNNTEERDPIVAQIDVTENVRPGFQIKYGGKLRTKKGFRNLSLHEWLQDFSVTTRPIYLNQFDLSPINLNGGFVEEIGAPYDQWFLPYMTDEAHENFLNIMGDSIFERPMNSQHPDFEQWVGSSYSYSENVVAGYAMADHQVTERLNIVGGLRAEYTDLRMSGDTVLWDQFDLETFSFPIAQSSSHTTYWALLPMLHFKYEASRRTNVRLSATRSFRRPNFLEAKPGEAIRDFTNLEFFVGNSNLKPSFAWNMDLMAETYFDGFGMLSGGVFYKHITDHIFATNTGDADPAKGIIFKSFQNADRSYVAGFEGAYLRHFDFLPGFLKNFGVNLNFTVIRSSMQVPGRPGRQPLPRQANFLYNAALTYETGKFNARLALNHKGAYLMELNLASVRDNNTGEDQLLHLDTDYDVFMDKFTSLDISVLYQFSQRFSAFCELNNLLNNPMYMYRGQKFRPIRVEYYSWRGQAGLRFSI